MRLVVAIALFFVAAIANGQTGGGYDLTWSTIDGGGHMVSSGANYALGGTIGQPDAGTTAGPLIGGTYSLDGGFWPGATCACPVDMNYDRIKDGRDVQGFVRCSVLATSTTCDCADLNHDGLLNLADVSLFVAGLLAPNVCP